MSEVLHRYRFLILIFLLLILTGIICVVFLGASTDKTPMRGVFVVEYILSHGYDLQV
ncbi:MAG: hypothetical protein N3I35_04090 [Clostridia bacterium]|nr:hypothetical protein [Clostridia bacterium]